MSECEDYFFADDEDTSQILESQNRMNISPCTSSNLSNESSSRKSQNIFHLQKETSASTSTNAFKNVLNSNESNASKEISQNKTIILDDDIDSECDEVIMCVFWKNGKFAAAYYNVATSEINILNETIDAKPDHKILINLYKQIQPFLVLTDSRATKTLIDALKRLMVGEECLNSTKSDNNTKSFNGIQFLPTKEYSFESCKRQIYLLKLPNEPENNSETNHELFLHSIINFHYSLTVHAMGALIKYLDKTWGTLNINSLPSPLYLGINIVSLKNIVYLDDESYKALQIFNKLPHPSCFKQGMAQSSKEGLSLFGIFNKCNSKIGLQHLRMLLQNPTNNMETLKRRQDTIDFCIKSGNEEIIKNISCSLRYIKNVNGILTRIKSLRAAPYEWKLLFNTLYNVILICETCEGHQGKSQLIDDLGSRNNDNLFQVAHHMNRVIDFDLTIGQGRFTVKLGIDPELDRKKHIMMGLHDLMSSTAKFELKKLPEFVKECTMIYLPNLGYLLGVKAWKENLTKHEKSLPNLKFMFQNQDHIYYKSNGCDELDSLIGDTHPEILAHEMRIMMRLTQFILKNLNSLSTVVKLCAELDCIISMAKICKENEYRRPCLVSDKIINVKNGRHPLQELCVNTYVPNDIYSAADNNLVTLLTGPNSCGKSIYLKQVALIVYMAHIGCFVPAESATIGLIDQIYTRIQTIEDISTRMSAFLIDIRQISNAIRGSTSSSLIIIDEFGKGTAEVDGLGLLAACINNFLFRNRECPHIFISTHFHNLIYNLKKSPCLKMMSMEYIFQDGMLVFLYKLHEGITKKSFALEVAQNAGIDKKLYDRAKEILENFMDYYPKADKTLTRYKNQTIQEKQT